MKQRGVFLSLIMLSATCCTSLPTRVPQEGLQWLEAHNRYRRLHGAADVEWSDKLAASAQKVAGSCPKGHSDLPYGENIAWVSVLKPPAAIVKLWYDEEPMYDHRNPGYAFKTGHFTQLVWKGTKAIGCGHAAGCNTRIPNVWVCHYDPPGNYRGQFAKNVGQRVEGQ